jgi:hypothetical protein
MVELKERLGGESGMKRVDSDAEKAEGEKE